MIGGASLPPPAGGEILFAYFLRGQKVGRPQAKLRMHPRQGFQVASSYQLFPVSTAPPQVPTSSPRSAQLLYQNT